MKPKKCKLCNQEFIPHKYSTCKKKCQDCIFMEHKQKLCIYAKKQAEKPKKPQSGSAPKMDKKWIELSKAIKERDAGLPCISCGKFMQEYEIQAGHYIARGKSVKLKYEPRNIHAQCWHCNNNHQIQQQMQEGFKKGLILRYGLEYVKWLENNK